MRAPDPTFADAIDAFRHRYGLLEEGSFFDRVRQCTGVPRARHASDYHKLVASLVIAWQVARVLPRQTKIEQRRREEAARKLDAIRLLREDYVLRDPAVIEYFDFHEHIYARCAEHPGEILDLEWVEDLDLDLPQRRDHLTFSDLGRKRRGAGILLFVREVTAAMREIFGKPNYTVVGRLAGLAFKTKALSPETVRTKCKKTGLIRSRKKCESDRS
jgi:hypothetical protein